MRTLEVSIAVSVNEQPETLHERRVGSRKNLLQCSAKRAYFLGF